MSSLRTARRALLLQFAAALAVAAAPAGAQSADAAWPALRDGSIVLFRHAEAPGIGDPADFRLGECSTQRNLDASGRAQAHRIGEAFRQRGVRVGAVLTSQWCRTRETAELAFPGQVVDDAAFNSFFGAADAAPAQTAQARATLSRWRGPGLLVVVTHQVNITALTGVVPASGEGVVLRPGPRDIEVIGRITP